MMVKRQKCPRCDDDLQRAFDVFDMDHNGYISREELRCVMESLGEKLSDIELDEMLKEADKDGDGQVNFEGERISEQVWLGTGRESKVI